MIIKKKRKNATQRIEEKYGEPSFSDLLVSHRKCEELSQVELARKLKMSRQNLCDLEKGRSIPSLERIEKISSFLGVSSVPFIEATMKDFLKRQYKNLSLRIVVKNKEAS
jgi:transcriptional regulator with XRE-family HTH domain